ncbi:unnamed protein product [Pylaiella littoralis]
MGVLLICPLGLSAGRGRYARALGQWGNAAGNLFHVEERKLPRVDFLCLFGFGTGFVCLKLICRPLTASSSNFSNAHTSICCVCWDIIHVLYIVAEVCCVDCEEDQLPWIAFVKSVSS